MLDVAFRDYIPIGNFFHNSASALLLERAMQDRRLALECLIERDQDPQKSCINLIASTQMGGAQLLFEWFDIPEMKKTLTLSLIGRNFLISTKLE